MRATPATIALVAALSLSGSQLFAADGLRVVTRITIGTTQVTKDVELEKTRMRLRMATDGKGAAGRHFRRRDTGGTPHLVRRQDV